MPNPLISFRLEPELLDALDRFASANGLDRTAVIRNAISQYINVPIDPVDDRLTALEGRVMEMERRLGTTGGKNSPVNLPTPLTSPVAFEAQRVLDRVESRIAEFRQPDMGDGISQNDLMRLCQCGDRKLRQLRDRPEELRQFTFDRTGQPFEFRDGKYYPLD